MEGRSTAASHSRYPPDLASLPVCEQIGSNLILLLLSSCPKHEQCWQAFNASCTSLRNRRKPPPVCPVKRVLSRNSCRLAECSKWPRIEKKRGRRLAAVSETENGAFRASEYASVAGHSAGFRGVRSSAFHDVTITPGIALLEFGTGVRRACLLGGSTMDFACLLEVGR